MTRSIDRANGMTITIRPIRPDELEAARRLLLANGWHGARFEPGPFAALCSGSREALVALDGDGDDGPVVGFARSVADGVSNGYLCSLVVDAGPAGPRFG